MDKPLYRTNGKGKARYLMPKSQVQQNPTSINGIKDGPVWPNILLVLSAVILVGVGICVELWRLLYA